MIRDGVLAGLLPGQLLETRLVIETATSAYLSAPHNDEQATARLFIQKAAKAADESWQHTVSGQQGPRVAAPTIASLEHPSSASQDEDSDDMDFHCYIRGGRAGIALRAEVQEITESHPEVFTFDSACEGGTQSETEMESEQY